SPGSGTWPARSLALLTLAAIVVILRSVLFPTALEKSRQQLRRAWKENDPAGVQLADQHVAQFSHDWSGLLLAAEIHARRSQHLRAMELFHQLPQDGGTWQLAAELGLARRCRILGRLNEEEAHLRAALQIAPMHEEVNHRLGHLLQVEGRSWESVTPFMNQIRRGVCRGDELLAVTTNERFFRSDDGVDFAARRAGTPDAVTSLGKARAMLFRNQNDEAERLLREVVAERPELGEAQGRLGRLVLESGGVPAAMSWRATLPEAARNHPEVWYVQGLMARRSGMTEGAAHCFHQTLLRSPNHLAATIQFAGCLDLLDKPEAARFFQKRAELLAQLESALNVLRGGVDEPQLVRTARLLQSLGRYWEAAGWLYILEQLDIAENPDRPRCQTLAALAVADPDQNQGFLRELQRLEVDRFAEPNWGALLTPHSLDTQTRPAHSSAEIAFRMDDEAHALGIDFQYFEGTTEANRLRHIFNVVGGGIGVVDIDHDGWPDLYLAQANDWRKPQTLDPPSDQLYRNLRGEAYQNITASANVFESGFSHGICAEDFDQDGFVDIYVCNLGANRLFRNLGDGTFTEVSASCGVAGNAWSIGGVMADVNGDGLPDLYVGNYADSAETAEKVCHRANGEEMACTPDVLTAASDQLYLNLGDGKFKDITDQSGIRETTGRALGMIGWDFIGNGRMSLFVANDTSAN
ncbi:MAG: VCBS repeat-containing protein, partial [Planctomycetaceae bacterium]|nr:VCBS repeat-containing protein [Planctomycetaceae bacterium]